MNVELLQHTSLAVCAHAIRTCWSSHDKSDDGGPTDLALIDRVGNKNKHASTLEHLSYTFFISGISRALLQELARHRIASLSVKSSRYTLKELKSELPFVDVKYADDGVFFGGPDLERASKYIVLTGITHIDNSSTLALEGVRGCLQENYSNDVIKYCLPESY